MENRIYTSAFAKLHVVAQLSKLLSYYIYLWSITIAFIYVVLYHEI